MEDKKSKSAHLNRRDFIRGITFSGGALALGHLANPGKIPAKDNKAGNSFKLNYAPHFGMFKHSAGENLLDQLKFMADQGFAALEDNGMMRKSKDMQKKLLLL